MSSRNNYSDLNRGYFLSLSKKINDTHKSVNINRNGFNLYFLFIIAGEKENQALNFISKF